MKNNEILEKRIINYLKLFLKHDTNFKNDIRSGYDESKQDGCFRFLTNSEDHTNVLDKLKEIDPSLILLHRKLDNKTQLNKIDKDQYILFLSGLAKKVEEIYSAEISNLKDAIFKGEIDEVGKIVKRNPNIIHIKLSDSHNLDALGYAIENSQFEIMKLLVESGSILENIDCSNEKIYPALGLFLDTIISKLNDLNTKKCELEDLTKAKIGDSHTIDGINNEINKYNENAVNVIKYLLSKNINVNSRFSFGSNILEEAISFKFDDIDNKMYEFHSKIIDIIGDLIHVDPSINPNSSFSSNILRGAIFFKKFDLAVVLISKGVKLPDLNKIELLSLCENILNKANLKKFVFFQEISDKFIEFGDINLFVDTLNKIYKDHPEELKSCLKNLLDKDKNNISIRKNLRQIYNDLSNKSFSDNKYYDSFYYAIKGFESLSDHKGHREFSEVIKKYSHPSSSRSIDQNLLNIIENVVQKKTNDISNFDKEIRKLRLAKFKDNRPNSVEYMLPGRIKMSDSSISLKSNSGYGTAIKFTHLKKLIKEACKDPSLEAILTLILSETSKQNREIIQIVGDMEKYHPEMIDKIKGTYVDAFYSPSTKEILVSSDQISNKIMPLFLHEATHMAADVVFDNGCNPFLKNDMVAKKEFEEVIEKTFKHMAKSIARDMPDLEIGEFKIQLHKNAFKKFYKDNFKQNDLIESIINVQNLYESSAWLLEYIVRIPQAIANGATEKDLEIVKPLVDYYKEKFLPKLREYNIKNKYHGIDSSSNKGLSK